MRLIVNSALLFTCFSFFITPLFAAVPHLPAFRTNIELIAYPTGSAQAEEGDKQVAQAVKQMRQAGFSDRVDKLFLAYQNKNIIWNTAQTILQKLEKGQSTNKALLEYVSKDKKTLFESQNKQGCVEKNKIYGEGVNLSINSKGVFPDRMLIGQKFNQNEVTAKVISFIYPRGNKIKQTPNNYLTLVLTATPPYKQWFLSNIYITKTL